MDSCACCLSRSLMGLCLCCVWSEVCWLCSSGVLHDLSALAGSIYGIQWADWTILPTVNKTIIIAQPLSCFYKTLWNICSQRMDTTKLRCLEDSFSRVQLCSVKASILHMQRIKDIVGSNKKMKAFILHLDVLTYSKFKDLCLTRWQKRCSST